MTGLPLILALLFAAADAGGGPQPDPFADLPTYDIATEQEIQRDYVNMNFKPLDDPELAMAFLLGKDWQPQPLKVSKRDLAADHMAPVDLVLVLSPDKQARIAVSYVRVPEALDLEEWVKVYLKGNRLQAALSQVGIFTGRKVVDVRIHAPKDQAVRMTFSKHLDRIFIIACSCPESAYKKFYRQFGLAVVSFVLTR